MTQTLICQHGNHPWTREASRGRKPRFCPQHDANAQAVANATTDSDPANTETLVCQHDGHTWYRPKTRGRKPPFCPQHRIGVAATATERPKGLPSVDVRHPAVQAVLDGPRTELQRKFEYTVAELENPAAWRTQEDWKFFIETHKRLIREAERLQRPDSQPQPEGE
jgi:hypothetical protein